MSRIHSTSYCERKEVGDWDTYEKDQGHVEIREKKLENTISQIVVKNITLCIKRRIFIKVPRVLYAKNALSLQGDHVYKGSKLSVVINL